MLDFHKSEIAGADALVGRTVSEIRSRSPNGGASVQRVTFIFDDGSSLVIDGTFPACSQMESPQEALAEIEGRKFGGISCSSVKPKASKEGSWEAALVMDVIADGDEVSLHWLSVGSEGFDETPEPRIHVLRPPHATPASPPQA